MTYPVFLGELPSQVAPGQVVGLTGQEAHHAVVVRRIRVGERIIISDGFGHGVLGPVIEAEGKQLLLEVAEVITQPSARPSITAIQALAKGDRLDSALAAMTEVGVDRIVCWQAERSIVRWSGERAAKSLAKAAATVREAAKQARRMRIPAVEFATTNQVMTILESSESALVLHESATETISSAADAQAREVAIVIGPEGGISDTELGRLVTSGAKPVLVGDHVMRTSTAGVVAAGQLWALERL